MQDLLLISDLHLGSHLKPRMRGEYVHLASRIEEVFPRFLDHYAREAREAGDSGRRWQLVINGDFIDFWNVVLPEERREGPEALAVRRLHAVFDAHPNVEDALARFVADGHGLVFVTGNHDAELLYPGVQRAIVDRLRGASADVAPDLDGPITRTGLVRLDALTGGRVRFVRWFLREPGGAWIEHGHKFDPACATPAALSPTRGGALVQTVAEVATRSFSNLVPEIPYDAADHFSGLDYLRWATARGYRFLARMLLLYLRMSGRLLALWARLGRVDRQGKAEHEQLLVRIADNAGLQMSVLQALEAMAPPPTATTVAGILRVSQLDLVLAATVPLLLAWAAARVFGAPLGLAAVLGLALAAASVVSLARTRRPRQVAEDMASVAAHVGELTGVPLVLMGHSHHGTVERRGDVVYGNSGSWLDGSHLVVRREPAPARGPGRLVAVELRRWRNGGITLEASMEVPQVRAHDPERVRAEPPAAGTVALERPAPAP